MSAAHRLSNLQQELLKLYSSDIPEEDLLHIKRYLANYFARKAIGEADQIWDEKSYTNETMNQWVNEQGRRDNFGKEQQLAIDKSLAEMKAGKVVPQDEALKKHRKWLKK